jgi:palmitoyltransferase ZDHHC9/14/18
MQKPPEELESIPQSSGLTLTSSSTVPILQNQKYSQTLSTATEEHMKKDSNETIKPKPNLVYRDRPYKNYQVFPSNTQFLLDGRLVTSKDYRAFIAALFLMIAPVVLFAVFK